jgi:hypothetical protein
MEQKLTGRQRYRISWFLRKVILQFEVEVRETWNYTRTYWRDAKPEEVTVAPK